MPLADHPSVDDRRLGMAVRAQRHRRGWRLVDLAAAAGVGPTSCSDLERGGAAGMTVATVRAIAAAVDLPLGWDVGWQRQTIDRLLDADHSALGARLADRLTGWGWIVRSEVSFNHYGDRGRIDILAYHPVHRMLLVVEIKTLIVDGQELLGGLDVKARVAPRVARELGWAVRAVVPAIVVADSTTARRRVADLGALLARYAVRGNQAVAWLRSPDGSPTGLLMLTKLPNTASGDARRAGRRRMRVRTARPRSREPRAAGSGDEEVA
jgi:transcriptional regulator with XRE-family HTH domain